VVPAKHNPNSAAVVDGPVIRLSPRHAKQRRAGHRGDADGGSVDGKVARTPARTVASPDAPRPRRAKAPVGAVVPPVAGTPDCMGVGG
jgi:hypothetical protein